MVWALYSYYKFYLNKLLLDNEGQTLVEYIMIFVLVAIAVFIVSPDLRNSIAAVLVGTSSLLTDAMSS
jgi:Flp pilus assembly pilin Flp